MLQPSAFVSHWSYFCAVPSVIKPFQKILPSQKEGKLKMGCVQGSETKIISAGEITPEPPLGQEIKQIKIALGTP